MSTRPLVGVSTYREQAAWGQWDVPAVLLPATYPDAVWRAGGQPVLLPTGAVDAGVVARLDAVVIAGGADVDPALYGAAPGPRTGAPRTDRDTAERAVLSAALDSGLPVLAVCRGMQLLNVVLGGTLHQHVPDLPGAGVHDPGPGEFVAHPVAVDAESRLYGVVGVRTVATCHHHQAVDRLGEGLHATAWADDGVVEALERDGGFCLGVQWHPEAGDDLAVFAALVAAAIGD